MIPIMQAIEYETHKSKMKLYKELTDFFQTIEKVS